MNQIRIVILFIITSIIIPLTAQEEIINYHSAEKINDIIEKGDNIWTATSDGVVRINKTTLERTIFNTSNSNIPRSHIEAMTTDGDGNIWIGSYDIVLAKYINDEWETIEIPDGLITDSQLETPLLYDFEISESGDIWIASSEGVIHKSNDDWELINNDSGVEFMGATWAIALGSYDQVYASSFFTYMYDGNSWERIVPDGFTEIISYSDAKLMFNNGTLWWANDFSTVASYDGSEWTKYDSDNGNGTYSSIVNFTKNGDNTCSFLTENNKFYKFDGENFNEISENLGENPPNVLSYYYIDSEGNHWVNSGIYLTKVEDETIQELTISENLLISNRIEQIITGPNNEVYFFSNYTPFSKDLIVLDDEIWSIFDYPLDTVFNIYVTNIDFPNSEDIALSFPQGFYHLHNNNWSYYSNSEIGSELSNIRKIHHDNDGNIYLIFQKQIVVFDGDEFTIFDSSNSPLEDNYLLTAMGQNNDLYAWIDYDHLAKLQDGIWTDYGSFDINPWAYWPNAVDKNSHPWMISSEGGALQFVTDQWLQVLSSNSGLVSDEINNICNDINGNIYFLTPDGISIFDGSNWETIYLPYLYNINYFNTKMTIDNTGNIWIGTQGNGVIFIEHSITTEVKTIPSSNEISISPNPTAEIINLNLESDSNEELKIQISDNLGKIILSLKQPADRSIDVRDLPSGNYFLTLFTQDKTISTPFVKK